MAATPSWPEQISIGPSQWLHPSPNRARLDSPSGRTNRPKEGVIDAVLSDLCRRGIHHLVGGVDVVAEPTGRPRTRFHVAGVAVSAHWSWALLPGVFALSALGPAVALGSSPALTGALVLVLVIGFMASLLAHELAHGLVGRHLGLTVSGIRLWGPGGEAFVSPAKGPGQQEAAAFAGPAANLLLSVLCWLLAAGRGRRQRGPARRGAGHPRLGPSRPCPFATTTVSDWATC